MKTIEKLLEVARAAMKSHGNGVYQGLSSPALACIGLGVFLAAITCSTPTRDAGPDSRKVFRNSDDSVNGMLERSSERALFGIDPGANELDAFKDWIRANTVALGLDPIDDPSVLDGLRAAPRSLSVFGKLRAHHFEQTYRGFKVSGPESRVSLTVVQGRLDTLDTRAIGFTGTILDPRPEYAGLTEGRLSPERAGYLIRKIWLSLIFELGRSMPSRYDVVGEVELVAVPSHRALAYRGEILRDGQLLAAVVIHSMSGEYIGYDLFSRTDTFDHRPIFTIAAYQMWDNPDTEAIASFGTLAAGLDGSTFGPCQLQSAVCDIRMGNDRATVYDFQGNLTSVPTVWLTPNKIDGLIWSNFTNTGDPDRFRTQNAFQKMSAALDAVDPLKSTAGWDHHPDAPLGVFDPAPLSLWTGVSTPSGENLCSNSNGKIAPYNFDAADWNPVEHPYVDQLPMASIRICNENEATLFHELGHYYDLYSTYGFMGTGLMTNSCIWDTPDESPRLSETLASAVMLYLYRKLYDGLPHTLGTTDTPCTFLAFQGAIPVHSGECPALGQSIWQFDNDRPPSEPSSPCQLTGAARMGSIWQAVWKSVNGMVCNTEPPYDCTSLTPFESDTVMESFLYALSLSNLQSYEQFFENAWWAVDNQAGTGAGNMFRKNMTDHGILEEL